MDQYGEGKKDGKTRRLCAQVVETCMRKQVLGDEVRGRQTMWEFVWKDGKRQMEKKNMTGGTFRKCIKGMKLIANVLFEENLDQESLYPEETRLENMGRKMQWHNLMDTFIPMMDKIEQEEDFTDTTLPLPLKIMTFSKIVQNQ